MSHLFFYQIILKKYLSYFIIIDFIYQNSQVLMCNMSEWHSKQLPKLLSHFDGIFLDYN